jgi:hypothetical protein
VPVWGGVVRVNTPTPMPIPGRRWAQLVPYVRCMHGIGLFVHRRCGDHKSDRSTRVLSCHSQDTTSHAPLPMHLSRHVPLPSTYRSTGCVERCGHVGAVVRMLCTVGYHGCAAVHTPDRAGLLTFPLPFTRTPIEVPPLNYPRVQQHPCHEWQG